MSTVIQSSPPLFTGIAPYRGKKLSGALSKFCLLEAPLRACNKTRIRKHAACCHATHHRISLCYMDKFSGLPESYFTLVAYVLPLAHTRARGSVLSHSVGYGHARRVILPMWRPARRLGARRYVKEQCSPCEGTAKLYPIAPWDARGHAQKAAVLSKIVKTLSAALRLGLTCRVENLQRRIKSSEIRLVPSY